MPLRIDDGILIVMWLSDSSDCEMYSLARRERTHR